MSFHPDHFTAWIEIPVTDLDAAQKFYETVLSTSLRREDMGPNETAMFVTEGQGGVAGHLYPGKPATDGNGPTVHLTCPDTLEATLERVTGAGGKVLSPAIEIPPGRFAYCLDPDGNSIGIFEHKPAT